MTDLGIFERAPLGTLSHCPASPSLPEGSATGIVVAAPSVVTALAGERFVVPLCLSYRFADDYLDLDSDFAPEIHIVATDTRTGMPRESLAYPMEGKSETIPLEDNHGPSSPALVSGFVNIDLATVLELPRSSGSYHLFAFLGDCLSNVLRIEVVA